MLLGVGSNGLARTLSWKWSAHSFRFGTSVLGIFRWGRREFTSKGELEKWRLVGSGNMCGCVMFIFFSLFKNTFVGSDS